MVFRQLLVPLDGSSEAEHALPIARKLAQSSCGLVHLVRVVPLPQLPWAITGAYLPQSTYDSAQAADERAAVNYLDHVRSRLAAGGVTVQTNALAGLAAPQLLLYEQECGIDLVVLGVHGHGGPARLALGSVTTQLLRHGTAPILLAGGCADPADLMHALVPLDGSAEHETVLDVLPALMPALVRQVSLVRVVRDPEQELAAERYLVDVEARLAAKGLHIAGRHVLVGSAVPALGSLARSGHLLIMATHAHAPLTHWFASTVAERLLHEKARAVLLVRTGLAAASAHRNEHDAFPADG